MANHRRTAGRRCAAGESLIKRSCCAVLRNLQGIAQDREDQEALLRYLEAMVTLAPDEPSYRGMRTVVRYQTGRKQAAIADLDWFLKNTPAGIDLQAIRTLRERFTAGE